MEPWEMTRQQYNKYGAEMYLAGGDSKKAISDYEKWFIDRSVNIMQGYWDYETKQKSFSDRPVHELIVKFALSQGKLVPPEVLKDYPDLIRKEEKMNRSKKVLGMIEKDSLVWNYPELKKIIDKIADETLTKINASVEGVESEMPYKIRYVLEKLIKILQERV